MKSRPDRHRLKLTDNLPKDPEKPYHFNNTAEFMLLGAEAEWIVILENTRRVMASAIVDPEKPEVHKARREWQPHGLDRGIGLDEIGVEQPPSFTVDRHGADEFSGHGQVRHPREGLGDPPAGSEGAPLRLIMGQTINLNSSTQRVEPVEWRTW